MQNTIWHPVLASAGKPKMAEPLVPVSESMGIEHEQHFDALALIQDMSDLALRGGVTATGQARVRCIILLNDGSRNKDTGKVCHLPVTIFADARHDGQPPQLFHQLRKATEGKIAIASTVSKAKNQTAMITHGSLPPALDSSSFAPAKLPRGSSWNPRRPSLFRRKPKQFHCPCCKAETLTRTRVSKTPKRSRLHARSYSR